MRPRTLDIAVQLVRAWARLYTLGMSADARDERMNEIDGDLWESQHDPDRPPRAVEILRRLVLGMPDDLLWRFEHPGDAHAGGGAIAPRTVTASAFTCSFTFHLIAVACAVWWASLPAAPVAAQQPPSGASFEVASVRPNTSGNAGWRLQPEPGGRLTGTNVPAAALIRFAYDLPDFQVSGGPKWLDSNRFDIAAIAGSAVPIDRTRAMVRGLLAERFKLTAHTETRELPIYALVMSRNDGKPGPQLRRSDADCTRGSALPQEGIGPSPQGGPPRCGYFGFAPGTDLPKGRGGLAFRGMTMAELAKRLVPMVRRSVSDHTGLGGYYDGDFDFVAELPPPPPPPGMPSAFGPDPFVSIFTVLPEQLGLKLDSRRGPVEVLVIDRIEPPGRE